MKRKLTATVLVLAMLLPLSAQEGQAPVWLQRVQRWLEAAKRHQPGSNDEAARAIGAWPRVDLQAVASDVFALRDLLKRSYAESGRPLESKVAVYRDHRFTMGEIQQLLGLDDEEARQGDLNRILWAGVLLHSDVALVVPPEDRLMFGGAMTLRLRDGQPDGFQYPVAAHWEIARDLAAALRPDPRQPPVALWYRASAARLLASGGLPDATRQLERGRQLFPEDADLLFLSGCIHEAYAAPDLQEAAASAVLPVGQTLALGSARSHLAQAETEFTKALEKNGRLIEARLRLGRVLGLMGRHREAAGHLREVAATVGDSELVYYACMFLGEEERALGNRGAARDAYDRAAALYPRAQSPLFAQSSLAASLGDMTEASRAAEKIRRLPADERERFDPWIGYYAAGGRDAATLWNNLLAAVPQGGRQ